MALPRATLLIALVALVPAAAEQVTPVQKVLQLLDGMVAKGKAEKHDEQVQFAAYKTFCDQTKMQKQKAITEANEMIEVLKADIQKYDADSAELTKKIAKHDEDISTNEADLKAATKVRAIENADYEETHKDYTESIHALEEAVVTLKKEQGATKSAAMMLTQLSSKITVTFPEGPRRAIEAFLQQDPDENLAVGAPEAAAYEFQAQGILDMLTKLQGKFEDERGELEDEETGARHAFEMVKMDLENQISHATDSRTEQEEAKAKSLQASADASGDLGDTTATRDDDSKYLADLTATCEQKAAAFAERQELRGEEIEAIGKARDILASGPVAGAADKHLPALVQRKVVGLAQLRSGSTSPTQLRVAAFLKSQGSRMGSRMLAALSTRVSMDPFKKVKKMIRDMINKLMEEANEEATQKGWCDTELATNEQTRKEKSSGVETLTAEIDELEASIKKLTEEIGELTAAVAESDAAVAKATQIREDEKAKNAITVKDAQEAQTAVAQALSVLKEFYEKAGDATSLVQQQVKQPAIFDEPYKGMGSENGGVVGMIEVIQSDFARLESDTTSAENEAQKEYDQFSTDSSVDKAQKTADIDHKTSSRQNQEKALQDRKGDLDGMQKELNAAMGYYEKLKPQCIDAEESYEDRVARRKEEIESLQEAVRILTGEE